MAPRVRPLRFATTAARWGVYLGVVCGVVYSVGGFFVDLFTTGLNGGTALAFMALVGMPALFGAIGFLLGGLFAWVARAWSLVRDG